LLINFLDHFYPSLLKIPEFLVEFVTPIVRVGIDNPYFHVNEIYNAFQVWKKKDPKKKINFFTIPEYEQWVEECPDIKSWESKYYKVNYIFITAT
jgi:DNA topoisomerase-2